MQGEDAIRQMARELYQEGVAAFLPTTMSASVEDTRRVIAAVRRVMDTPEQRAARVLGAHMEAPFLSPERGRGAAEGVFFCIRTGRHSFDLTGGDIRAVRVITMAPELPSAGSIHPQGGAERHPRFHWSHGCDRRTGASGGGMGRDPRHPHLQRANAVHAPRARRSRRSIDG